MKFILIIFLMLVTVRGGLANQLANDEIEMVINNFEQAIYTKDKSRFLSLFVDGPVQIIGVVSDESMVERRARTEEINKRDNKNFVATRKWTSTPETMINRIIADKSSNREVFSNIKVLTDNNIAMVYFDYEYYIDNKKMHWGSESWQLVQTLEGWKISSISYSITFLG